ncbi:uncharacterized protein LOC107430695 [Ziziphus jujuba]|uniref:Uncharacterized protein LOC107430695 n=2 Tax=Ziziphus jujuba TaxID=326968 RepID=A0A6P4B4T0_ZIZJJ|nr:uncharacterized protein LOC107430695 [Ziziphus jujuba]XP_015897052.2 uncharacterized protein LOC107430695 [Ziziphus jujuba]KAH7514552.1 hypothetical protein FEM48_Zijuj11G0101500 [Ziziphus jujuba var. spinosa]
MGFSSELKNSSKQQNDSNTEKTTVASTHANQVLKHQDRLKLKNHVGPSHSNLHYEFTRDAAKKSSGNQHRQNRKGSADKHVELVKHMSNLPGYLQHDDRGENLQEKAFNVGVLDWAQLEKWKTKHKYPTQRDSTLASCSTSNSSLNRSTGLSASSSAVQIERQRLNKQHSSHCSSLVSSRKDKLSSQHSAQHARFQDLENASKNTIIGEKISQSFKSFGKGHSGVIHEREKTIDVDQKITPQMRNVSEKFKTCGASPGPKESINSSDGKAKNTKGGLVEKNIKRKTREQFVSKSEALASKQESGDISLGEEEKSTGSFETKKIVENLHEPETDAAHQHHSGRKNAFALIPKKFPQKGSAEVLQISQHSRIVDKNDTKSNKNKFSDGFSTEENNSARLCSEIPHSCPLLYVESNATSDAMPNRLINHRSMELSSVASQPFQFSDKSQDLIYEGKCTERSKLDIRLRSLSFVDTSKTLGQETYEMAVGKGRNPSPLRRLSFSLGRMGRSFSFKEGSAVPQLNSTHVSVKSGPVNSSASDCVDFPNREKANGHNRARSSPLRRLLDPILKHKEAHRRNHSEAVLPPKGSLINSSSSVPVQPSQDMKHEASWVQALLHLTIKNGLPLFKFEVDNNSNILATTMKNLSSSGKDGSGQIYTFYFVNEIKRKNSGWINQGSRGKNSDFVYNIVGKMKVSNSSFSDTCGQDSSHCLVRECVLVGVELKQADQESPKLKPNRELAAAVVKIPSKNTIHDNQQSDENLMEKGYEKCLPEDQCSYNLGEHEHSNSTTVILPSGDHSTPNKGEPSPLLDRWKSGGLCDCGGWDVGCKLRVLSKRNKCSKISKTFKASPTSDCLELFVQGEAQQDRPIFSLVPLKEGIYKIEFNASITHLQAFFICIVAMSSQKPSDLSDATNMSEAKAFKEPDLDGNDIVHAKVPAKYATNPPLSPVGRV